MSDSATVRPSTLEEKYDALEALAAEAQRERDAVDAERTEALRRLDLASAAASEIARELDRQGAPPGPLLHQRVRGLARALRVGAGGAGEARSHSRVQRAVDRDRAGVTHHFCVDGHDGYLIINLFDDGTPGEIFLRIAKAGSTMQGLLDLAARFVSRELQYGGSLTSVCYVFYNQHFPPCGPTTNPEIPRARSIPDYVARYLVSRYVGEEVWRSYVEAKQRGVVKGDAYGGINL